MSCAVCAGYSSYNCPVCGEEGRMVTCPDCKGTGYAPYKAWHIHRRVSTDVTEATWRMIPKDEDEAYEKGENWCRMDRTFCPTCHGEGEVHEDY